MRDGAQLSSDSGPIHRAGALAADRQRSRRGVGQLYMLTGKVREANWRSSLAADRRDVQSRRLRHRRRSSARSFLTLFAAGGECGCDALRQQDTRGVSVTSAARERPEDVSERSANDGDGECGVTRQPRLAEGTQSQSPTGELTLVPSQRVSGGGERVL